METYEYGRIKLLAENLVAAGISEDIVSQILAGGETIGKSSRPEVKAAWMAEAMARMDRLLKPSVRHAVREGCATPSERAAPAVSEANACCFRRLSLAIIRHSKNASPQPTPRHSSSATA
jgi:hypothetical protein